MARVLTPSDHPFATKRPCLDTGYFETFNRENVTLVDLRQTPITEIVPTGIRTTGGVHELDSIVFATGFDAMTGPLLRVDIRGRGDRPLERQVVRRPPDVPGDRDAGFPNLFILTGPGSPSVLSNMVMAIEQHVDWIADCLSYLGANGLDAIEATVEAEDAWVDHVNQLANATLFPRANSWYMGANVPGKPARLPALRRRLPAISRHLRRRGGCGVPRVHADPRPGREGPVTLRVPVPPLLRRLSSDEYRPLPWRRPDREALARFGDAAGDQARRAGLAPPAYVSDRRGTAAALRAIDAARRRWLLHPARRGRDRQPDRRRLLRRWAGVGRDRRADPPREPVQVPRPRRPRRSSGSSS